MCIMFWFLTSAVSKYILASVWGCGIYLVHLFQWHQFIGLVAYGSKFFSIQFILMLPLSLLDYFSGGVCFLFLWCFWFFLWVHSSYSVGVVVGSFLLCVVVGFFCCVCRCYSIGVHVFFSIVIDPLWCSTRCIFGVALFV